MAAKKASSSSVANVFKMAKDSGAQMVDFRFTDLPGMWQHFTSPIKELEKDTFVDGVGFDGSSIRGFQEIQESDMLLIPDPSTAFIDPFMEVPTLVLICTVQNPTKIKGFLLMRAKKNLLTLYLYYVRFNSILNFFT